MRHETPSIVILIRILSELSKTNYERGNRSTVTHIVATGVRCLALGAGAESALVILLINRCNQDLSMTTNTDSVPSPQANAEAQYDVKQSDLPLSCPMPDMPVWNSHPKVYLPIEKTGEAKCPYCGAQFTIIDNA